MGTKKTTPGSTELKDYTVLSPLKILEDGANEPEVLAVGSVVSLTGDEAAELIANGTVAPVAATKSKTA